MTPTNWLPGIVFLVVGLLTGGLYLLLTRKKPAATGEAVDNRGADLELRAQALIEELKELEANKHQLDPAQHASERARLERAAADAFRARDEHRKGVPSSAASAAATDAAPARPATARPTGTGFFARHPELKGAVWGGGVVLFFGLLGAYLFIDEKQREEGGTMTGKTPPGASAPMASAPTLSGSEEQSFQEALESVRKNPQDIDLVAAVVHELLRRQEWDESTRFTSRALSQDAFHVEHRIHRAVLTAVKGDTGKSVSELMHLANVYPDAQEALLFAGAIAMESNDKARALSAFEQYASESRPSDIPEELVATVAQLRRELGRP